MQAKLPVLSLPSEAPPAWINKNFEGKDKGCEDATRLPDDLPDHGPKPPVQGMEPFNPEKHVPVDVLLDIPCARPVHTLFDLNVELQLIEEGKRYPFVHGHLAPAWRERIEEIEGLKKTLDEAKRHLIALRGASKDQHRSTMSSAMDDLTKALGLGHILDEEREARASWGVGATHS